MDERLTLPMTLPACPLMQRNSRKLPNEVAVSPKRVDPSVLRPKAAMKRKTVFPV